MRVRMIALFAVAAAGVACIVGAVISDDYGARANGMSVNSYMIRQDGRYFAVARGAEARILKEITVSEYNGRMRYKHVARILAGAGIGAVMLVGIVFIGLRLAVRVK